MTRLSGSGLMFIILSYSRLHKYKFHGDDTKTALKELGIAWCG